MRGGRGRGRGRGGGIGLWSMQEQSGICCECGGVTQRVFVTLCIMFLQRLFVTLFSYNSDRANEALLACPGFLDHVIIAAAAASTLKICNTSLHQNVLQFAGD